MTISHSCICEELIRNAAGAELPEGLTDPQGYIRDVNRHVAHLLGVVEQIPL